MKSLYVLFILLLSISCVNLNRENNSVDHNEAKGHFLQVDGRDVELKEVDESQILESLGSLSKVDSIKYLQNEYWAEFGQADGLMYKFGRSGSTLLQYDRISENIVVCNATGEELCKMKVTANNPEFNIETIPLENELGFLLLDGIYGITKFLVNNGKCEKVWEISFDKMRNYVRCFLTKSKDECIIVQSDAQKDIYFGHYSLQTGELFYEEKMKNAPNNMKLNYWDDLLASSWKNELRLIDVSSKNKSHLMPTTSKLKLIDFIRDDNKLVTAFLDENGIHLINTNQGINTRKRIVIPNQMIPSKLFITDHFLLIQYFESNTPGVYSNETIILNQGVILFDRVMEKGFLFGRQNPTEYLDIQRHKNEIIGTRGRAIYKLKLDELN